jgi:hypothetical protein
MVDTWLGALAIAAVAAGYLGYAFRGAPSAGAGGALGRCAGRAQPVQRAGEVGHFRKRGRDVRRLAKP